MTGYGISALRWAVGVFCGIVGVTMLVVPHQLSSPVYALFQDLFDLWGSVFLILGIGLIALNVVGLGGWLAVAVHLLAGGIVLALGYGLAIGGGWTGATNYALLGLGTALAPLVGRRSKRPLPYQGRDFLSITIGAGAAVTGLSMLLAPGQFTSPGYDMIRPYLALYGAFFFVAGLAVVYVNVRPAVPRSVYWLAHLAAAAALLTYFFTVSLPLLAWIAMVYYGGFGIVIALLPWMEPRIRRFLPGSLRARLAFTIALAGSLPLIFLATLLDTVYLPLIGGTAAASIDSARDVTFFILVTVVILAIIVGILIARWLVAPLGGLVHAANRFAAGDATAPLPRDGAAEMITLISTFGEMRDRLANQATERERLLAEMQQRAAELRATIDSITDAVYVVDARGQLTLANTAGKDLLGSSQLERLQRVLVDFPESLRMRHPSGQPVAHDEMPVARALRGEVVKMQDVVVYDEKSQRDRYFRDSAAPIKNEEGKIIGAVVVTRDVTDLVELDRLKDEFIRVAAHELKTPVAIMKGYTQALERLVPDIPPERRPMLEAIERGADRINRVVNDLLDISQIQLGQIVLSYETIDLVALVEGQIRRIADTPGHRVRLVHAEPAMVRGDRLRLEQVVRHLLENAIKYSPHGGDVDVAVRTKDGVTIVSVRDYGIGIPREKQPHIFERFYRAHTGTPYDYGGMGVGLFIAREVVRRLGGRMWFESHEGKGSTFYFSLPLATPGARES